jgi:oxygen-independent coproporphyrinogen III oxidase
MPLGLYISVPFCRTKCTYCNFASDVFSRTVFQGYVNQLCSDIEHANSTAEQKHGQLERTVDSVYLGGGTPTVLDIVQLERIFVTIAQNFNLQSDAEITVECAPGTLTPALLKSFARCGVNRVSLGVQSFVDEEARAVGRLHNRATVLEDIAHLREAGISNINIDLIAGLPHQTVQSWEFSLQQLIACGVPHASIYMLEVDEDSRLGRELIAGGTRYHAHFVPDEDVTADLYETACRQLNSAGVRQYEISNFGREGYESRHNLKYWTRQPYLGFGVDAHSMLWADGKERAPGGPDRAFETKADSNERDDPDFSPWLARVEAVRFAAPDSREAYLAAKLMKPTAVSQRAALEETFFLGLRLSRGVDLRKIKEMFGQDALTALSDTIAECVDQELLECEDEVIRLTPRGRLLSNEVFERFIAAPESVS